MSQCLGLQLAHAAAQRSAAQLALAIVAGAPRTPWPPGICLKLKRALRCNDDALREAQPDPPGSIPPWRPVLPGRHRYVVPDVVVRKIRNTWVVSLNPDAMPRLRINQLYAQILRDSNPVPAVPQARATFRKPVADQNVQQRFETIQRVSQAIVDRQRRSSIMAMSAMRPLYPAEIAEQLDQTHESTVSRVTTQSTWPRRGAFSSSNIFRQSRRHRQRWCCLPRRRFGRLFANWGRGRQEETLVRRQDCRVVGPAGYRRRSTDDRKVPRVPDIPPVSLRKTI